MTTTESVRTWRPANCSQRPATLLSAVLPPAMGIVLWARLVAWLDLEGVRWLALLPLWGGLALLIGAARASYSSVLFPVVALLTSTLIEDYRWSFPAVVGILLTLIGNWLILSRNQSSTGTE